MSDEWGPWVDWRCAFAVPSGVQVGDLYQAICVWDMLHQKRVENNNPEAWQNIKRFRIRKPKGLAILEGVLEHLPDEVDA